jgi:glycine cleavage system H protein
MKLDPTAKYTKEHEWVRPEGDLFVCGITDYAQDSLSDVVFVELPEVGQTFELGDTFGTVESVKTASDLFMPMSGEIVAINDALVNEPELVNSDPYEAAWMIKFKPANPAQWDDLLSGEAYQEMTEA